MIYLIGGAPRLGKSILAQKIKKDFNIPALSMDILSGFEIKNLTEDERKKRFPVPDFSSKASENTITPEQRVELTVIGAKSMEPMMSQLISDTIRDGKSLLLEGYHILPEFVRDLSTKYGEGQIRSLFIGSVQTGQVTEGILKNTVENWITSQSSEVIYQAAEFVVAFSDYIRKEAEKYKLPYTERTTDFESDIKRLSEKLLKVSEIKLSLK